MTALAPLTGEMRAIDERYTCAYGNNKAPVLTLVIKMCTCSGYSIRDGSDRNVMKDVEKKRYK